MGGKQAVPGAASLGAAVRAGFRHWQNRPRLRSFLREVPASSRWARWSDPDLLRLTAGPSCQPGRVTLGWKGLTRLAGEPGTSTLVIGPSQSGKTTNICVPAILEWDGPVIAASVKRDLIDLTAGWRQVKGKTMIFDPLRITKLPSIRNSPYYYCRGFAWAWDEATMYISSDWGKSRGDSDEAHWMDAAHRLLAVAFYAGAWLGVPIAKVRAWINDSSGESLEQALAQVPEYEPIAAEIFHSVQQRPAVERASCYSATQRILSVFVDRRATASAAGQDWDPEEFLNEGENTLYLIGSPGDQQRFAALFNGVLGLAATMATGRMPKPLLLVLDDCGLTARFSLPKYLSTGFKLKTSVVAAFHDLAEIRDRYGNLTSSIVNDAHAKLFLPGQSDIGTLDLASQLVGQEQHRAHTYLMDGTAGSYSRSRRPLAGPDTIRQLRPGLGLLVYSHVRPVITKLRPWFRDPMLRHRSRRAFDVAAASSLIGTEEHVRAWQPRAPMPST
jgi:type IV secretion system protein VirD4